MNAVRFDQDGTGSPAVHAAREDTPRTTIVREIVRLHKEHFGRGPTTSKAYIHDEYVLVLMFGGHTVSERSLERAGQARGVAQARVDLSESIRQAFIKVVERETGRKVMGFMSSSQQDPSLLSHVYVLAPGPSLDLEL